MYAKDPCQYPLPDIEISWGKDPEGGTVAIIRVSNLVIAQLTAKRTPGRSLMAKQKGPLADVLT